MRGLACLFGLLVLGHAADRRVTTRDVLVKLEARVDSARRSFNQKWLKGALSPTYYTFDPKFGKVDFWGTFRHYGYKLIDLGNLKKVLRVDVKGSNAVVRVEYWSKYADKHGAIWILWTGESLADDHWDRRDGRWVLQWTRTIRPMLMHKYGWSRGRPAGPTMQG